MTPHTVALPTWLNKLTGARELSLNQNSFTGTIPTTWDKLTKLRVLRFDDNQLTGGIPAELGVLSDLEELWLDENALTGTIPAGTDAQNNPTGLAKLTKLTWLSLGDNELTGGIPAALGGLTKLTTLWLSNNKLTGGIPTALGNLTEMEWLYLNGNELTGGIPTWLGNLTELRTLYLQDNNLTGGIPTQLSNLTELVWLRLNGNSLTGSIPAWLGNFTELTTLHLHGNKLTGGIPAGTDSQNNPTGLAKLTKLRFLRLGNNQLSGEIPPELGDLPDLRWLLAHRNQLSGEIPAELGNLTKLQYLYLHVNRLTGSIPAGTDEQNNPTGLAKLPTVYWIYLNCNDLTGTVPDALGTITTLRRLGINGNTGLDPTLPAALKARTNVTYPQVTCSGPPASDPPRDSRPAPVRPRARLTASLSAAPDPVRVGGSVTYTLTVTNTGSGALSGVFWRSPELGVARRAIGDGALAVDAMVETTFSFGPVTEAHHPGPIVVTVFADSDQSNAAQAALAVAVQPAAPTPAPTPTPGGTSTTPATGTTAETSAADPQPAVSDLDLTITRAFYSAPDPPDPNLGHNILALQLTQADGTAVICDFLAHYLRTGGLARWGYATSEILEERPNTLTQYYQRGAVDCHFRDGRWRVERRLTWDFIGGGLGGAPDPGVEAPRSEYPGLFPGPWGLRVSNFAVDGTFTGFRDFFQAHGGVAAFGYPKTEARYDDDPAAVLRLPEATPGFIRQYFQAAVFEFHPDDPADPVKLGLAGDALRDLRYPNQTHQRFASFRPAPILTSGEGYVAERVVWNPPPP